MLAVPRAGADAGGCAVHVHNELLTTLVMYIGRLAAAGQLPLLRQIGMSPPQVERIRRLSLAEMNELSALGSQFMDIRVDAESFERALAELARRLGEKTVAERLLRAGACYPVMKALTGMETREFVAQRQMLGLAKTGNGRAAKPDAESQHRICKAWVDAVGEADPKLRLLAVHAATGFPVRVIWPVVNAWEGQGELPIADDDHGRWLALLNPADAKPARRSPAGHPVPAAGKGQARPVQSRESGVSTVSTNHR